MSVLTEVMEGLDKCKEITKEIDLNRSLKTMTSNLETGVSRALNKAADYVIKAMPIPDHAKDILIDVKSVLKTKDFKTILSTAVKSSIREGLEMIGLSKTGIESVFKLKDIAVKGGLIFNIKNSIETISQKFMKNNIVSDFVKNFFNDLKSFVQSNAFLQKISEILKKISQKKDEFLENVKKWYISFNNSDFKEMNNLANKLQKSKDVLAQYPECEKENRTIQNITAMTNNKNEKLSDIQLQLCTTL